MQTHNPYFNAIRRADKMIGDNIRSNARRNKKLAKVNNYMDEIHAYVLTVGGKAVESEPTVEMSGREAWMRNEAFRLCFIKEIEAEVDAGVGFRQGKAQLSRFCLKTPPRGA